MRLKELVFSIFLDLNINTIKDLKILLFLKNNSKKIRKSPSVKCQRAGIRKLPLLDTFRTFKGNIAIENIRLNQLILQY